MIIAEFDYSVNFIDPMDVFVGFDYTSSCCESFGYLFLPARYTDMKSQLNFNEHDDYESLDESMCMFKNNADVMKSLENYIFDPSYMDDDGDVAVFKLLGPEGNEVFLHLYNYHNGYYGHGFSFNIGPNGLHEAPTHSGVKAAKELKSGCL